MSNSKLSKPSPITPLTLFRLLPPSKTLDHLTRLLSTWSGTDKFFMLYQYTSLIAVWVLKRLVVARGGAGLGGEKGLAGGVGVGSRLDTLADSSGKLGGMVGDARILYRIWGLLPIIQWIQALSHDPSPPDGESEDEKSAAKLDSDPRVRKNNERILLIERLQAWSMIFYYPLEHIYYLSSHTILHLPPNLTNTIGLVSCRFWALYVLLQFYHLHISSSTLSLQLLRLTSSQKKATTEPQASSSSSSSNDDDELRTQLLSKSWSLRNEFLVNLGYLPLTVHWSLENGLFPTKDGMSGLLTGVFGTIAAVGQWKAGWRATA